MKRDYDLKVHSRAYEEWNLVYILDTATVKGKCLKLSPSWKGPGIVVKMLSPYLNRVKTKAAVMVANLDRLKKCVDRDILLWLSRYREKFLSPMPEGEATPRLVRRRDILPPAGGRMSVGSPIAPNGPGNHRRSLPATLGSRPVQRGLGTAAPRTGGLGIPPAPCPAAGLRRGE
uniref:Uncharacterized protein LOC111113660 n=1 Tax=Crassostrea virginica TaxID=6565 RepID=A0A8B8BXS7_CRAVI|nr:uncharacterized protein LOC111113660 [Crassostrea virginica]